jgi:RNA polymerase sigma-70 factor (ECF subfamily)
VKAFTIKEGGRTMDDAQIIQLYFERSEDAIEKTKIKYGDFCFHIANNILKSKEDAEECENDAYLKLWNAIPPQRPNVLKSYLGKIVRNLALRRYEYYSAQKRNVELEIAFSELEECIVGLKSVEGQFDVGDLEKSVNRFLHTIDREPRIIFVRRYWYADSMKEIAARFRISESKVKSSLFRTRNKLRIYLQKEGFMG